MLSAVVSWVVSRVGPLRLNGYTIQAKSWAPSGSSWYLYCYCMDIALHVAGWGRGEWVSCPSKDYVLYYYYPLWLRTLIILPHLLITSAGFRWSNTNETSWTLKLSWQFYLIILSSLIFNSSMIIYFMEQLLSVIIIIIVELAIINVV